MADSDALYLVDGYNFLFRAYHALPPLSTKAGVPSGADYGFTNMLIKLEVDYRPSHLAVVFDAGAKSFRNDLYAEYKANRPDAPEDLKPQFGMVRRVVESFGIRSLEAANCEADDLIAALVKRGREAGLRTVVVSSDKDLMQLVGDGCVLIDTMKNVTYGEKEVEEKFGVPPKQLGDLLALMGDSVDNVPGVPGVGPKTASVLVREFGSIENLLAHIDDVPKVKGLRGAQSVADKLRVHADAVRLSRKLVALDDTIGTGIELAELRRNLPEMPKVEAMLRELEFTRLIDRMRPLLIAPGAPTAAAAAVASAGSASTSSPQSSLPTGEAAPALAAHPPKKAITAISTTEIKFGARTARVITDDKSLTIFVGEMARAKELGISFHSAAAAHSGLITSAALIGIGVDVGHADPAYIPLGHRYLGAPAQLKIEQALAILAPVLQSALPPKHIHGAKNAEILLGRHGVKLRGIVSDPEISSYLIDAAADHSLKSLAAARTGQAIDSLADLCGTGKKAVVYDTVEVERAARFAAISAEATLHLGRSMRDELDQKGMGKLLDDLELPLSHVLSIIEPHGVKLDIPLLHKLGAEVDKKLMGIEEEVRTLAGQDINLGSPKQLQDLLFVKLGLPAVRKTKTGYSTDADVLEELAPLHPVAAKILEHRMLAKLNGTYIDALPLLVEPRTGRLHTSYQQTVAATGRLSSTDPNLQNVPIRSELGREIRRAFVAEPGNVLIALDYSQIELRVLAHLSGDPVLTDAFRKNEDIHERTVREMFGAARAEDPNEVKELRRVAKMINYGIIYGLSDFGLAQRLGIERADAKRYIEGYLKTYSGVAHYMESLIEVGRREGGARTVLGRFRPLPELASPNRNVRMYGERMARNTPIQGSAADLLKLAMIDVQRYLDHDPAAAGVRMLLTVHDELVLEAPAVTAEATAAHLKEVMEKVQPLTVPLLIDLGIGPTWADAK